MKECEWLISSWESCGKPCEGTTSYCGTHNRLIRKEAEQEKKLSEKIGRLKAKHKEKNKVPRPQVNKVSEKRKELNKEYFILVEQFKKDNPHCKAKVNEYCTEKTEDVHHKSGRVGKNLLDTSTWLPVCRSCHQFIEGHPQEAKDRGWSESRLATQEPHKI